MHERWLILAVLTLARAAIGFQFQSVAAISPLLIEQLGLSYVLLGLLIGLYLLPGVVVSIPSGMLAQRFGDKRMLVLGLTAMALGGAIMSAGSDTAIQIFGRVVSGVGGVIVNLLVAKMLTDWFAGREIATAFGVMVVSWPLGIAAALAVLPTVASSVSWHAAMLVPAAISALALLLVALCYRVPDSIVSRPAGRLVFDLTRREFTLVNLAGLVWAFYNVSLIIVLAFGPAFAATSGWNATTAAAIVSITGWVIIPAIPLSAWLIERTGRTDLAMQGSFGLTALAIALLAMLGPSVMVFALIGLLFAPPGGPIMTLPGEAVAPERRALGMGVYLTWYYAAMGAFLPLSGYARDLTGGPATPLWLAVAMIVLAAVALASFRRVQARPQV